MNEKVGYLNVFFQRSRPSWLPSQENIADYFPDPVFLYNTGTDSIEYANQKFAELARSSSDEMNDYGFLKAVLHPDDHENFQRLICSNPHPNEGHHAYCIARLADRFGRYRFHRIDGNFLPTTEAQQTQLILFVAHDITDELKSKAEIETTRELLDETEELLQFGSWAWEVTTNIVTWTPGLFTLLEYSPGEVNGRIGLSFYLNHVVEEYQQPFQELLQTALNSKSDFSYEYVIKTNSGVLKNISTKGKIVKDDNGEVMKMLCINRDITALRSFEKEQERNIRELNRSNRDLEEFAYIASHDLQEPLRKISMFTERLKAKFDNTLDKEGELFIERILASANNMRILIDNLLDFSRANRRSHTFDEVNIKTILDAVIALDKARN